MEWRQALTHDTNTHGTHKGTTHLRRGPAEKDNPADPKHPKSLEQAMAHDRDTALNANGLRTPEDNSPPPPTHSDQPPPEGWCTILERGHHYIVSAAASPGPQWVFRGTDTMLAPGATPPGAVGEPITPHRVLRGVLQLGDQALARAPAQITSGRAC